MKYQRVLSAINHRPWAIMREKGDVIIQVIAARAHGIQATPGEIQAAISAARPSETRVEGGGAIAVIPVFGSITHRADAFSDFSGGTSIAALRKMMRRALADPQVGGILWEFDTPGGVVDGVPELADEIAAAKDKKPMAGISNTLSASAGYWLMSQLPEIASAPSALTGSVGVYMAHADWSSWNEKEGVKITYVSYGENKVEGNPDQPLSEETQAFWQSQVDAIGQQFEAAVAKGRGIAKKTVRETFGSGRVYMAEDALRIGMVDRIATFDEMVDRLAAKVKRSRRADGTEVDRHAEAQEPPATTAQADLDLMDIDLALRERST